MSSGRPTLADKINRSRRLRYMANASIEASQNTSSNNNNNTQSNNTAASTNEGSTAATNTTQQPAARAPSPLLSSKSEKRKALAKAHMKSTLQSTSTTSSSDSAEEKAAAAQQQQPPGASASASNDSLAEKRRRAMQRVSARSPALSTKPIVESYSNESSVQEGSSPIKNIARGKPSKFYPTKDSSSASPTSNSKPADPVEGNGGSGRNSLLNRLSSLGMVRGASSPVSAPDPPTQRNKKAAEPAGQSPKRNKTEKTEASTDNGPLSTPSKSVTAKNSTAVKAALAAARPRLRLGAETSPGRELEKAENSNNGNGKAQESDTPVQEETKASSKPNITAATKKKTSFNFGAHQRMFRTRQPGAKSPPPPPPPPPPPLLPKAHEIEEAEAQPQQQREPPEDVPQERREEASSIPRATSSSSSSASSANNQSTSSTALPYNAKTRLAKHPLRQRHLSNNDETTASTGNKVPSDAGMSEVTVSSVHFRSEILQPDFDDADIAEIANQQRQAEEAERMRQQEREEKEEEQRHAEEQVIFSKYSSKTLQSHTTEEEPELVHHHHSDTTEEEEPKQDPQPQQRKKVSEIRNQFKGSSSPVPPNPMHSPIPHQSPPPAQKQKDVLCSPSVSPVPMIPSNLSSSVLTPNLSSSVLASPSVPQDQPASSPPRQHSNSNQFATQQPSQQKSAPAPRTPQRQPISSIGRHMSPPPQQYHHQSFGQGRQSPFHGYGSILSGRASPVPSNHGSSVMGRQTPVRPASENGASAVVASPMGPPDLGLVSPPHPKEKKSLESSRADLVLSDPLPPVASDTSSSSPPRLVSSSSRMPQNDNNYDQYSENDHNPVQPYPSSLTRNPNRRCVAGSDMHFNQAPITARSEAELNEELPTETHEQESMEQDAAEKSSSVPPSTPQQPTGSIGPQTTSLVGGRVTIETPESVSVSRFKAQFDKPENVALHPDKSLPHKNWRHQHGPDSQQLQQLQDEQDEYKFDANREFSGEAHDKPEVVPATHPKVESTSQKPHGSGTSLMHYWKNRIDGPSDEGSSYVEEQTAEVPLSSSKKRTPRKATENSWQASPPPQPKTMVSPLPQQSTPLSVEVPVDGNDRATIEVPEKLSVANMAGRFQHSADSPTPKGRQSSPHVSSTPTSIRSTSSVHNRWKNSSPAGPPPPQHPSSEMNTRMYNASPRTNEQKHWRSASPSQSETSTDLTKRKPGRPSWARQSDADSQQGAKHELNSSDHGVPPSPGQARVMQEQAKWRSSSPQQSEISDMATGSSNKWKQRPSWARSEGEEPNQNRRPSFLPPVSAASPSSWRNRNTSNVPSPELSDDGMLLEQTDPGHVSVQPDAPYQSSCAAPQRQNDDDAFETSGNVSPVRRALSPNSANQNREPEDPKLMNSKNAESDRNMHDLSVMTDRESPFLSSDTMENADPVPSPTQRSPSQAERLASRGSKGPTHQTPTQQQNESDEPAILQSRKYMSSPPTLPAHARSKDAFEELQKKLMKRQHDIEATSMASASTAQFQNLSAFTASVLNNEPSALQLHEENYFEEKKAAMDEHPVAAPTEAGQPPKSHTLGELAAQSIHAVDYNKTTLGFGANSKLSTESLDEEDSRKDVPSLPNNTPVPKEFAATISQVPDEPVDETSSAVFGAPDTYGAAGGDAEEAPPTVADRAKAIANWRGGRGTKPPKSENAEKFASNIQRIADGRQPQHSPTGGVDENEDHPQPRKHTPPGSSAVLRFWKQTTSEDLENAEQFHGVDPVVTEYVSDVQASDASEGPKIQINRLISPSVVRDKRHSFRNRSDKQMEGTEKPGSASKGAGKPENNSLAPDPFSPRAVGGLVEHTTRSKPTKGDGFDPFGGDSSAFSSDDGFGDKLTFAHQGGFLNTTQNDDGFDSRAFAFGSNQQEFNGMDDAFGSSHVETRVGFGHSNNSPANDVDNGFSSVQDFGAADDGFGEAKNFETSSFEKHSFAKGTTRDFPADEAFVSNNAFAATTMPLTSDDGFASNDAFAQNASSSSAVAFDSKNKLNHTGFPSHDAFADNSESFSPSFVLNTLGDDGFGDVSGFASNFGNAFDGEAAGNVLAELDAIQEDAVEPAELFTTSSSSSVQPKPSHNAPLVESSSANKFATESHDSSALRPPSRASEDAAALHSASPPSDEYNAPPTQQIWSFETGIDNTQFENLNRDRYTPEQDPIQEEQQESTSVEV